MLANSSILITGGTGSFGNAFVPMTLKKYNPRKIVIFSRDEMKQWEMAKKFKDDPRIRFFIGDVRDKDRLCRALDGIDFVVHAAATKIVPTAEYDPFECVKTNVIGAMNLIDACIDKRVKRIVSLSTDKASSPANLYGATKLCAEKLFVNANRLSGYKSTIFSVVRYGNVIASRGSVVPYFKSLIDQGNKNLPLTIVKPGTQTRRFTHIDDTIDVCIEAWKKNKCVHYSISNKTVLSIIDVAKLFKSKITFLPKRSGERYASALTTIAYSNKIHRRFGKKKLKDYIERILKKEE